MRSTAKLMAPLAIVLGLFAGCDGCDSNLAPLSLTLDADPTGGRAPLSVQFTATLLGDQGETGVSYAWDFDDGSTDATESPEHTFTEGGVYAVTLTVTRNDDDHTVLGTVTVTVEPDSEPTVSAAATPEMGLEPLAVQLESFVSGGDGAITYSWDLGDGSTSTLPNPQHTYSGGSYDATVTVVDEDGDTAMATVSIAVGTDEIPAATATATPSAGAAPLTVDLGCAAVGGNDPLSFTWDFGDGGNSTLAGVTHTYTTPGVYVATCVVTDDNGSTGNDSVTITVAANNAPTAIASATPVNGDVPLAVSFTGTGLGGDPPLTYSWSFGDGNTSTMQNPQNTYMATGTFGAILTVTDADGDFAVDTVTITVNAVTPTNMPPTADAVVTAGSCAVPGETLVTLDASASTDPEGDPLTYQWVFTNLPAGSSAAFNNAGVVSPTFVPDLPGTYTMRVFVNDGTTNVASGTVSITASGPSVFTMNPAGDGQTTEVVASFPSAMSATVMNACGAPVPNAAIDWTGTNASPDFATTFTDVAGFSANTAFAGDTVGAASLTATVAGTLLSVTFNHTVTAGQPWELRMELPVTTNAGAPMPLSFQTYDFFGNPTDITPVSFDVCVVQGNATFGMVGGTVCEPLTTSGGTAATVAFNGVVETAWFEISNTNPPIFGWAQTNVFFDDLEAGDDGNWFTSSSGFSELFELGTPTAVGPAAAFSGSNAWGTDLNANYLPSGFFMGSDWTGLERNVDWSMLIAPGGPGPLSTILSAMEYIDVNPDATNCPSPGGMVSLGTCGFGGCLVPPDRGYDTTNCAWGPGNFGSTGDWIPVTYDISPWVYDQVQLSWALVRGDSVPTGAGWYLDDISVDVTLQWVPGTFVPGAPAALTLVSATNGTALCSDADVQVDVEDAFGNEIDMAGITLDWSVDGMATFTGASVGTNFVSSMANAASVDTDPVGTGGLFVADTVGEVVTVSAEISGDPASSLAVPVTFFPGGAEVCDDGADNDCDGIFDCADLDCVGDPVCPAAVSIPFAPEPPGGIAAFPFFCDDCTTGPVPIGFNFSFFGTNYSDINISENGLVGFEAAMGSGCCSGQVIPLLDSWNNIIAVGWQDMYDNGGEVTYETRGSAPNRRFVVSWNTNNFVGLVAIQLILYEAGDLIEIHTTSMTGTFTSVTQGVENVLGDTAFFLPGRVASSFSLTNDAVRFDTN